MEDRIDFISQIESVSKSLGMFLINILYRLPFKPNICVINHGKVLIEYYRNDCDYLELKLCEMDSEIVLFVTTFINGEILITQTIPTYNEIVLQVLRFMNPKLNI